MRSHPKFKTPNYSQRDRSFAGMVNFLSLFCLELQKMLKPTYDLIRKGRQFIWEKEQQIAFGEIKRKLKKPTNITSPDNKGRFHLYSDTSTFSK